jgi:hypothetical protein
MENTGHAYLEIRALQVIPRPHTVVSHHTLGLPTSEHSLPLLITMVLTLVVALQTVLPIMWLTDTKS